MRARQIVAKAEQLLRCAFDFRKNIRHVGHAEVVPQGDCVCFRSIRGEFSNHLSDLLSFTRRAWLLQLEPRLQVVGISRQALPVALITPQNKTQQRRVQNQHRSLKVFRNVKTLDTNGAEMPPQRGQLSPCDGRSGDDYHCQYYNYQTEQNEPEAQGQQLHLSNDRQITVGGCSVITIKRAPPAPYAAMLSRR